jgi:hypothetical protein
MPVSLHTDVMPFFLAMTPVRIEFGVQTGVASAAKWLV